MYLGLLKDEEKELFLDLAYIISHSDGDFMASEEAIIKAYCSEMQITERDFNQECNLNEIIQKIQLLCDEKEKRIILFEAVGLAKCDSDYSNKERDIINQIRQAFGVSEDFVEKCDEAVDEIIKAQQNINNLVLGQ